jgi:DNA polymerase-3 subunit epsilon/ATP-dependent DNA helicase DinG
LKVAPLKGRTNYLCLRRWGQLSRSDALSVDDAKLLSKTSVWLQNTDSGDRSEINLMGRDAATWNHISSGERGFCLDMRDGSTCFLRSARQRAEQAHIIVVNHALLMTDLAMGGGLIPDYQHVVIDEAHHLEDAATSQFGFELSQGDFERVWEPAGRLGNSVRQALAVDAPDAATLDTGMASIGAMETEGPRLREGWERLFAAIEMLHSSQRKGRGREQGDQNQILITPMVRSTSAWEELHLAWENLDTRFNQAGVMLKNLRRFLDSTRLPAAPDQQALVIEAASLGDGLSELAAHLESILGEAREDKIHWLNVNPTQASISLHSAPLDVSRTLAENLFEQKDCVVLTSATLSTGGDFEFLRRRVGVGEEADDLLVGSPFDYQRAAQALIPDDMPQPNANGYVAATADVLAQLGLRLRGRTMALFTSHSSLRAVAQRLRPMLEPHGIPVMAQGVDGSAPYLMSAFAEEPGSVLLGTASFWEGVDMPSGLLKALVITRLPFQVPSDPIVQSRSALYDDPFSEYSIPNAVLRFRQGIGRLIRNKEDRGTIVVLDSRISTHGYGPAFQDSMPPCTLTPCLTANVGTLAERWLEGGRRGTRR